MRLVFFGLSKDADLSLGTLYPALGVLSLYKGGVYKAVPSLRDIFAEQRLAKSEKAFYAGLTLFSSSINNNQ